MSAITVSQPRPAKQRRQEKKKKAVNIWVTTATSKTNISPATPCQRWWYLNRNQPATSEVTAQRVEISGTKAAGTIAPRSAKQRTLAPPCLRSRYIASDQRSNDNHNTPVSATGQTNQQSENTTGTAVYQERAAKQRPFCKTQPCRPERYINHGQQRSSISGTAV